MGPIGDAEYDRRRGEAYGDLTLSRLLAEPPRAPLSCPEDFSTLGPLLGRIGRDRATPAIIRRLLGRTAGGKRWGFVEDLLQQHSKAGEQRSPDVLLSLLTAPHRAVPLSDGSWWLLTTLTSESVAEEGHSTCSVAWVHIQPLDKPVSELITEFEVYELPDETELLQEQLVMIAMLSSWKPVTPPTDQVLAILGNVGAITLAQRFAELEARAAVEGFHLTTAVVPIDSSSREWQAVRQDALQCQGPVIAAVHPSERSVQRILETLAEKHGTKSRIGNFAPPETSAEIIQEFLQRLASEGALSPVSLSIETTPRPIPAPSAEGRIELIYLSKTGSGKDYDVLVPTGRRCSHNKKFTIRHRGAPKKYKGVQKFLQKTYPGAELLAAWGCKASGCGLVAVRYQTSSAEQPTEKD